MLKPIAKNKVVWLRLWGDYDKSQLQYSYSLDGKTWENIGEQMLSPYQLKTFQGVRVALYAFNKAGVNGGVADLMTSRWRNRWLTELLICLSERPSDSLILLMVT